MSGLELVQAMVEGTFAHPSMADTIPMRATEAARGRVTFTVRADTRHLNPLGGVHGGFAATVLDSVTGCAVHTMLDVGVGYGTVDLNVKMLKAVPLDRELTAEGRVIHLSRTIGVSEGSSETKRERCSPTPPRRAPSSEGEGPRQPRGPEDALVLTSAVMLALLAGVSAATWTICLKLGSGKINAALGAMVIAGVAFLVNAATVLAMRASGHEIGRQAGGALAPGRGGIAASGVDIFQLLAYERGLPVTSSFIIGGTSTALVLLVGFVAMHEPLTWVRFLAIALIAAGILLLQTQGA